MTPHDQQRLEHLVHNALRDLPPRKAPATLESRINAEIARRAALPWWRRSFVHWPVSARIGFLVVCAAIVRALFVVSGWIHEGFTAAQTRAEFEPEVGLARLCGRLLATTGDVFATLVANVPPLWLYGGAAILAALYLTLFGLGAAAYKTLYSSS